MKTPKYKFAILDEERKERDKFINYFEDDFNVIEISFVESIDALVSIIKSENIDAIAIDYNLKDHNKKFIQNGDYFFKNLNSRIHNFPSFVLTQDPSRARRESKLISSFLIVDKEKLTYQPGKEKDNFIKEIKHVISIYKLDTEQKIKRVKQLESKRLKGTLTDVEEQEFLELNNELSKTITGYNALPQKYFSQETNKKLNEIIAKTDKLIKSLETQKTRRKK